MIYHGYENGFRTLGRQTLLEPIEWTSDGWFHAKGGTLSAPLPMPSGARTGATGVTLADDFSTNKFGVQWSLFNPGPNEMDRVRYEKGALILKAKDSAVADSSPLSVIVGDRSYEACVTLEISEDVQGGLLLFYNQRAFCGIGFSTKQMFTYNYGEEHAWMRQEMPTSVVHIKVANQLNVVTFHFSRDGSHWTQHPWQMEVSGLHHNVLGGFLSLKPGIYSIGRGEVIVKKFTYRGLHGHSD